MPQDQFQYDFTVQTGEHVTLNSHGERCKRTAIILSKEDAISIDVIDRTGRFMCRLNLFDTAGEHSVMPRGTVDVIPAEGLKGRFHAMRLGQSVVAVTPPEGVTVCTVIIQ